MFRDLLKGILGWLLCIFIAILMVVATSIALGFFIIGLVLAPQITLIIALGIVISILAIVLHRYK